MNKSGLFLTRLPQDQNKWSCLPCSSLSDDPRGGLAKVLAFRVELLDMVFKSSDKIRHGSSCNEHPFKTMHSAE